MTATVAVLRTVRHRLSVEEGHLAIPDSERPYRLHDAQAQKFFAYRCYVHKIAAMRAALWITKWLPIGATIEVIDIRNMRLHGAYTRRVHHIEFRNESLNALPREVPRGLQVNRPSPNLVDDEEAH